MTPDFKGHHFVEDVKPNEPPGNHHSERCGMKAVLRPDGSTDFYERVGVVIGVSAFAPPSALPVQPCT